MHVKFKVYKTLIEHMVLMFSHILNKHTECVGTSKGAQTVGYKITGFFP